jgi:hypothetical protein
MESVGKRWEAAETMERTVREENKQEGQSMEKLGEM